MSAKKKTIKYRSKKMSISKSAHEERVRLTVLCTPEQRKYMKIFAAHEDRTLNDFILDCVFARIQGCAHSHTPNKETADALDATDRKEGLIHFDSVDDFIKSLKS